MVNTANIALSTGVATPVGSYTESSAGTPGTVATSNRFGLTVTAMVGSNEALFAISSPYQKAGSVFLVDQANRTRGLGPWVGRHPVPHLGPLRLVSLRPGQRVSR